MPPCDGAGATRGRRECCCRRRGGRGGWGGRGNRWGRRRTPCRRGRCGGGAGVGAALLGGGGGGGVVLDEPARGEPRSRGRDRGDAIGGTGFARSPQPTRIHGAASTAGRANDAPPRGTAPLGLGEEADALEDAGDVVDAALAGDADLGDGGAQVQAVAVALEHAAHDGRDVRERGAVLLARCHGEDGPTVEGRRRGRVAPRAVVRSRPLRTVAVVVHGDGLGRVAPRFCASAAARGRGRGGDCGQRTQRKSSSGSLLRAADPAGCERARGSLAAPCLRSGTERDVRRLAACACAAAPGWLRWSLAEANSRSVDPTRWLSIVGRESGALGGAADEAGSRRWRDEEGDGAKTAAPGHGGAARGGAARRACGKCVTTSDGAGPRLAETAASTTATSRFRGRARLIQGQSSMRVRVIFEGDECVGRAGACVCARRVADCVEREASE